MADDLAPISHLLVEMEAEELNRQVPTLLDTLYENPQVAIIIERLVGDVYSCAGVCRANGGVVLDGPTMGVRLGAWRKLAQDALAITERS